MTEQCLEGSVLSRSAGAEYDNSALPYGAAYAGAVLPGWHVQVAAAWR
eukprot:CAMPEP_0183335072 /NCGR_PEP_ID=MMETSP0164_2-20130417/3476_1 /TAXON_ID=221442 /ORGANISM="Coccolithus pelagicus ssp braarudi, Strain PLY182g" /LENGTH=47 /DNA_ID= /DNA_START= /DNA_END= /DNA_ORIENTATION=